MKRLWWSFAAVLVFSFGILGWIGTRIYQEAPPLAAKVLTTDGRVVIDEGEIQAGQNVWQSLGGMQVGSVWGHGSYVAPDWTADWLHRESVFMLDEWSASQLGTPYESAMPEQQAALRERLKGLMRSNKFDASMGTLTIDPARAKAFEANQKYYADVFSNGNIGYAIPKGAQTDPAKLRELDAERHDQYIYEQHQEYQ